MKTEVKLLVPTPIQYLGEGPRGQKIYIKRDDLLGFSFGGNKCRIGVSLLSDMKEKGADFMVSYGSRKSNLNRVIATMCKSQGIPCIVISSEEEDCRERENTFNASIVRDMGIEYVYCQKTNVAETVENTLEKIRQSGFVPYYVYGDQYGVGNEAAASKAYQEAYREILQWEKENQVEFDRIFLACGTGMTQGGLAAGKQIYGGKSRILGISVARDEKRAAAAVKRYADAWTADPAGSDQGWKENGREPEVQVLSQYLCGGYGSYDTQIETVIRDMMQDHGIALDPTYTGKAYAGMLQWLEQHGSEQESVLFLHTGGMPLYFDYLRQKGER